MGKYRKYSPVPFITNGYHGSEYHDPTYTVTGGSIPPRETNGYLRVQFAYMPPNDEEKPDFEFLSKESLEGLNHKEKSSIMRFGRG